MAVEWERVTKATHYQVRSAGGSVRLYTNGVFHSQWNPSSVLSGALWDLLGLPLAAVPQAVPAAQSVLVLGVGGGAVIRQLEALFAPARIVGVELDQLHLQIARRWFGLASRPGVELHHGDAIRWVAEHQQAQFDLVIDDLFGHHGGEANRTVPFKRDWARNLSRCVRDDGILVVNHGDRHELLDGARQLRSLGWPERYSWSHPAYENRIGIFSRQPLDSRAWRRVVAAQTGLPAQTRRRLLSLAWRRVND